MREIIFGFGFLLLAREIALGQDPAGVEALTRVGPALQATSAFNRPSTLLDSPGESRGACALTEDDGASRWPFPGRIEPARRDTLEYSDNSINVFVQPEDCILEECLGLSGVRSCLESAPGLAGGDLIPLDAGLASADPPRPGFSLLSWDLIGSPDLRIQEPPTKPPEFDPPHKSFPGYFKGHFSGSAWGDVWKDYFTQTPILLPVGLAVAAAGVSHWDHRLERHFAGQWGKKDWIGDGSVAAVGVGALALSVFFPGHDRSGWDGLWNCGEALGATAGLTSIIKRTVLRKRPGSRVPGASFPSGHASIAFAAATLIEDNSGDGLGIPAYVLATVTALSRIETGDHFPSDVLAGAALGTLVAGMFDALHFGTGRESKGICGPHADVRLGMIPEGGWGVTASIDF